MDQTQVVPVWAFYVLLLLFGITVFWLLHSAMKDDRTPLEWWQFVATKGKDGVYYADSTKLGQVLGILLVLWLSITLSAKVATLDWVGFMAIMALFLSYLAGVQVFLAYLKSKQPSDPQPPEEPK